MLTPWWLHCLASQPLTPHSAVYRDSSGRVATQNVSVTADRSRQKATSHVFILLLADFIGCSWLAS